MPMVGAKCGFGHILWVHAYLVVPLQKIQLGEASGAFELVQKLINGGDGKPIPDGDGIQGAVVYKEPP